MVSFSPKPLVTLLVHLVKVKETLSDLSPKFTIFTNQIHLTALKINGSHLIKYVETSLSGIPHDNA